MTVKQWITVAATAFVGGAWAYVSAHLADGLPSTGKQWLAFGVGAAVAGIGALVHLYQTAPPDAAIVRASKLAAKIIPMVLVFGIASANVSCTPAQQAVQQMIEQTILDDLAAGKTLAQVEQDIGRIVAGQPGADVVIILDDALALLIDLGIIPPGLLPVARTWAERLHPEAMSHRALTQAVRP